MICKSKRLLPTFVSALYALNCLFVYNLHVQDYLYEKKNGFCYMAKSYEKLAVKASDGQHVQLRQHGNYI